MDLGSSTGLALRYNPFHTLVSRKNKEGSGGVEIRASVDRVGVSEHGKIDCKSLLDPSTTFLALLVLSADYGSSLFSLITLRW